MMNFLFFAFGAVAYLIAAYELVLSLTMPLEGPSKLDFIAFGVFAAWGTASLVGAYLMDVIKNQRNLSQEIPAESKPDA